MKDLRKNKFEPFCWELLLTTEMSERRQRGKKKQYLLNKNGQGRSFNRMKTKSRFKNDDCNGSLFIREVKLIDM